MLQQEFHPAAPNRCWAGDITYIRTTAGWRYLAIWIDLYSRRVVGWAMGASMEATLVLEASTGLWDTARLNLINS